MPLSTLRVLEIAAGAVVVAGAASFGAWMMFRKRPTAEEVEIARRQLLSESGRLVDGTLLDVCDVPAEDGRALKMLLYSYRIGGVNYECTQDVTELQNIVNVTNIRAGFPCSVRYQPGNPQNSIVVSEKWSGIRASLPMIPSFDRRHSFDPPSLG